MLLTPYFPFVFGWTLDFYSGLFHSIHTLRGITRGSVVRNLPASAEDAGDMGSVPGWGRSPGGGNGNPLLYPWLENPMGSGTWQTTVHGVTKSWI